MLARIWLRKQRGPDYDPTKEDIKTADVKVIRASLTEDDVNGMFDRGEQVSRTSAPWRTDV